MLSVDDIILAMQRSEKGVRFRVNKTIYKELITKEGQSFIRDDGSTGVLRPSLYLIEHPKLKYIRIDISTW